MIERPWFGTALSVCVVALVLAFRWKRMQRSSRLRLETLWIVPAIFIGLVATVFIATPPPAMGWLLAGIGLIIGALVGWQRGRSMRIEIDPETHRLSQQASPAAILFLVGLIAVRSGMRAAAAQGIGGDMDPAVATDALLGFGLGMIVATRSEMFLRARRLLRAARAGAAK